MSSLSSVQLAIDVATTKREQAESALQQAVRAQQHGLEQMAQLSGYADETQAKWQFSAHEGTTPELMRHHYQFMERLMHAIDLQKGVLEQAAHTVAVSRQFVVLADIRLASLNHALKQKRAVMLRIQMRGEQKQTDEFAAMRASQNRSEYFSRESS
jgi:flagellar FliJ protein